MGVGIVQMSIDEIGRRLVHCKLDCEGIRNEPKAGVLPRCLILEKDEEPASASVEPDCIVVGINPGISGKREREFYRHNDVSYAILKRYFFDGTRPLYKRRYFKKLRDFAREVGLGKSILWTDLCKCESKKKGKLPPLQTFRTCVRSFLKCEIELFPDAPIIAVGNQAYHAFCYMFPERFIMGIPHPTGSYGNFSRLFENGKLMAKYRRRVRRIKDKHGEANCVKIFPP
jgi:hypothetical protein